MAPKNFRNYVLIVDDVNLKPVSFTLPFSMEFDIQRNNFSSSNIANFRIYNLAPVTQGTIYKDITTIGDALKRSVALFAGYGQESKNLPLVFFGKLGIAWSVRESPNVVTEIQSLVALDAAVLSQWGNQYSQGTPIYNAVLDIANYLSNYGISIGSISPALKNQKFSTTQTIHGVNAFDVLAQLTGNNYFIDNQVFHVLTTNDVLPNPPFIISNIIQTPLRQGQFVLQIQTIFEPSVRIGQVVTLADQFFPQFNGTYKVISISHRGLISPTQCGEAITTIGLFYSTQAFNPVSTFT